MTPLADRIARSLAGERDLTISSPAERVAWPASTA
jgi:hypothetical protein